MRVIIMLGVFMLLSGIFLIVYEMNDVINSIGYIILLFMGSMFMTIGIMEDYENNVMKENNINPDVMEYIISIRSQDDETSITTDNAIAVYLECKRNGFNEEETISFLLPDITKEEAKSIVKTYNLLEEEN